VGGGGIRLCPDRRLVGAGQPVSDVVLLGRVDFRALDRGRPAVHRSPVSACIGHVAGGCGATDIFLGGINLVRRQCAEKSGHRHPDLRGRDLGRDVWLQNGDTFSVVFGILARFAPLELRVVDNTAVVSTCASPACHHKTLECVNGYHCLVKVAPGQRQWNLRPPALGLLNDQRVTFSMMVLVIVLLATVTFDGLLETPLWTHILDRTLSDEIRWVGSAALVLFSAGFLFVYLFFSALMCRFAQRYGEKNGAGHLNSTLDVASVFVLTLVPIAIAYHLAHYLSYLLITGQYFIPRVSDPFGYGWDLFGTADYKIDIGQLSARVAWYLAVTFVVLGHVFAVYVAHVVARRTFGGGRAALLSQVPMVVLMVLYTMVSLWILAQPMVA